MREMASILSRLFCLVECTQLSFVRIKTNLRRKKESKIKEKYYQITVSFFFVFRFQYLYERLILYLFFYPFVVVVFFCGCLFSRATQSYRKTIMLTYLKLGGGQREPVRIKPLGSALARLCRHFFQKREF